MKKILFSLFLIINTYALTGQKIMLLNNGKIYRTTYFKAYDGYYSYKLKDLDVAFFITDDQVDKIIDDPGYVPKGIFHEVFEIQNTRALKMSISGFSGESLIMSYEQQLSIKWHVEGSFKLHQGDNNDFPFYEADGWGAELGIKYIVDNPYHIFKSGSVKQKMQHVFIKPTIGYSDRSQRGFSDSDEYSIFYIGSSAGAQFVLGGRMSIELSAGLYYYDGSGTSTPMNGTFTIPILLEPEEGDFSGKKNLGTSLSIKFGFLF
ncbi:MAG: hypothetical protein HKN68_17530 [Saprospiraceae bacterium]|nr:hypothetical protein [Saprospiraceae bacterium]